MTYEHECPDWDYLKIDENSSEFLCCQCYPKADKSRLWAEWEKANLESGLTLKIAFDRVKGFFNNDIEKTLAWFYTANSQLAEMSPWDMIQLGKTGKLCDFIFSSFEENQPIIESEPICW